MEQHLAADAGFFKKNYDKNGSRRNIDRFTSATAKNAGA
jgi:hypothetical protein